MSEATTSSTSASPKFPRAFWVVNGIELLERGAFYSLSAVFTVFMLATFRQSMPEQSATALAGTLGALLFLLLYVVPVVGAPFTEKFGYRASLGVVFVLLAAGYVTSFVATGFPLILASILLIGVGAGIFKPIPASIVSQTSSHERRNLAFAIYYACINVGALVFPGVLGILGATQGWSATQLFRTTFAVSASLAAANLLVSIFVFRNLRPAQKDVSVLKSVKTLGEVFRYPSFLVLMVIYAGFWFMYVLSLTFLSAYMQDFGTMPAWFNVSLLQTINPLVIIVLAPFSGFITKRVEALPLMVGGIILYAIGLVVLGFTTTSFFFVTGVVLFSIGELLTHPSYLSYVSKIAPPDKVSVFLGYGFIPIGVGQFVGAKLGGNLYGRIATTGGHPQLFWALMASVGLATAAALAIYSMVLSRRAAPKPVAPGPTRGPTPRRFPAGPVMAALAILLVPAVLAAATFAPSTSPITTASVGGGGTPLATSSLMDMKLPDEQGKADCGKEYTHGVTLDAGAAGDATFTLKPQLQQPSPGYSQTPDTWTLTATDPAGKTFTSPESTKDLALKAPATAGTWQITAKLTKCGADEISTPIMPVNPQPHASGTATLGGSYQAAMK